jgi:hypothetical protein
MPQVLTMTQKPGETTEAFAARISGQISGFFKGGNTDGTPAEQPDMPPAGETSAEKSTDETAAPEEEPAPSA